MHLKPLLERIYRKYHCPDNLGLDPLSVVRGFRGLGDREIAGFAAALLSYGRVEQINADLKRLFSLTGRRIRSFVLETSFREKKERLAGFSHRFNNGLDMAVLFEALKPLLREQGTLGRAFAALHAARKRDLKASLHDFTLRLKTIGNGLCVAGRRSFDYLLPSPLSGSACKRLNMFLRWMVRKDDGIDLGLWPGISPADLVVPMDTHLTAVGRRLRLTRRRNADWRAAEEVTAALKRCSPGDPLRYDFSLCHAGKEAFRAGRASGD